MNLIKRLERRKRRREKEKQKQQKEKQRLQRQRDRCIDQVMRDTGWSRRKAIRQIENTRKRLGATYKQYRKYELALVPPEEQARVFEKKKARDAERAELFADIQSRNGWTEKEAKANIKEIKNRTGSSISEIWSYKLEKLSKEEQEAFFFKSEQRKIGEIYPQNEGLKQNLNSKKACNIFFSDYIRRKWCMNDEVEKEEFCELFKNCTGVIYKPEFGNQARGIQAFRFDEIALECVFDTLKEYQSGVVEELVKQHPKMAELNPTSVNCLRIMTVSSETKWVGEKGKHADIMGIIIKTGGAGAVMDNLHAGGGVAIGIDLETGVADTDGVDWYGNVYEQHPVTGITIRGFEVPFFAETKAFMYEMIEKLHIEGVIGWDIAISDDGPVLIEGNSNPAPRLLGLPYSVEKKGIKDRMIKYMSEPTE